MKHFEKYSSFIKKSQDYKLISIHNKIIKKLNLDSSILSSKFIPLTGIYKLFKVLTNDYYQLTDDDIVQMIIYILIDKLNINIELKRKIQSESELPDFKTISNDFVLGLNTILTISNIFFKNTKIIDGFKKLLDTDNIIGFLNSMVDFSIEHNLSLQSFTSIIDNKNEKVLKSLIEFIQKDNDQKNHYHL